MSFISLVFLVNKLKILIILGSTSIIFLAGYSYFSAPSEFERWCNTFIPLLMDAPKEEVADERLLLLIIKECKKI